LVLLAFAISSLDPRIVDQPVGAEIIECCYLKSTPYPGDHGWT